MVLAIDAALTTFANNDSVKHIAIMSSTDRAFCAGGDIRAAYAAMLACDVDACEAYFRAEYQLTYRLATFEKPVYAFINGLCLGGGMGISVHCKARIAGENSVFGMPETGIGFFPDVGAAYFYNRFADPAEGMYLALTGNKFDRDHALRNGIATHAIDQSHWKALIGQLSCGTSLDECEFTSANVHACYLPHDIQIAFSHKALPELIAALPSTVLTEMRTKSFLSITVTHAHMQRARGKSLKSVLKQDFSLAMNFVRHGEFKEGVRALLIDKDKAPKWLCAWQNQAEPYDVIPEEIITMMFNPPEKKLF